MRERGHHCCGCRWGEGDAAGILSSPSPSHLLHRAGLNSEASTTSAMELSDEAVTGVGVLCSSVDAAPPHWAPITHCTTSSSTQLRDVSEAAPYSPSSSVLLHPLLRRTDRAKRVDGVKGRE